MIAQINEKGVLRIIPQGSTEMYALQKWWEDYTGPVETRKACLQVEIISDNGVETKENDRA